MFSLLVVVLLAAAGSKASQPRALWQFYHVILCSTPGSHPLLDFSNYGCYCGFGGSGTPVDDLDKCCQIHDNCYSEALKLKECRPIFDNPYTIIYSYTCSENTVTCINKNSPCKMFVCECDRKAAICFSKAKYNRQHKNLDQSHYCK
ncbi:phospholipase A2 [Stegostoma tigrinum]|uniref:phospholipase A2 n=1 Tax=Stegostoma tigrinum TaxID=3053191 RepID=UPI00202B2A5F|nr:phospholipase A2 [Stegostoma tigrinum]